MSPVLNEVKYAEYIMEKGEVGPSPTSTLFLLGKYYRQKENLDKEQTTFKLNAFMQKNYKNYNPALWEAAIEDISKKADKYPLREMDSIGITQSELDKISKVENPKYEKLLFAMLCYAKFYNTVSEHNNDWINTKIREIYRSARVTVKYRNDKFLYLNDLAEMGLISFSDRNDNLNIQIHFADMPGKPVLTIDDFRELGYEYSKYLGEGKYIKCRECGRLVKIMKKKDGSTRYCPKCKQMKTIEKYAKYNQKRKLPPGLHPENP